MEGKLECQLCSCWVSVNPNSLEVHTKTHLNFKQHQCAYCSYRSCIAGKVKRHIDNVHNGEEKKVQSFTALTPALKRIIADTRALCFHNTPSEATDVRANAEALRQQLLDEMQTEAVLNLPPGEKEAAQATYQAAISAAAENSGTSGGAVGEADDTLETPAAASSPSDSLYVEDDCEEGDGGRLQCHQCWSNVADNPSSLGLHVRNHLDYKPFSCNLCDYKSCIQAKIKRHLRNKHKCPTDEMTYAPEPDIRLKVCLITIS